MTLRASTRSTPDAEAGRGKPSRSTRRRWLIPALFVLGWLALAGVAAPFQGRLAEVQVNDNAAFLPSSAEATAVNEIEKRFAASDLLPTAVVYERAAGITPADLEAVQADLAAINELTGVEGEASAPIPSQDGKALLVAVPVTGNGDVATTTIGEIRKLVKAHPGLSAHVTGAGGVIADFTEVFELIDGLLLLVAGGVVALILVLVYRSPLLPVIVIVVVVSALAVASLVVYLLTDAGVITLNGQSQGILFVLVFGATTDYALLLVARYREELHHYESRYDALRTAWRASVEPILASGSTVILGMLCMLLSDLKANRSMGPVAAIGIGSALLAGLTFLPAILALTGRASFWPFRPVFSAVPREHAGRWARIARVVGRRPRATWVATLLALAAAAALAPTFPAHGTPDSAVFLERVDSVEGQEALARHFPGGAGSPAIVVTRPEQVPQVVNAVRLVEGVAAVSVRSDQPAGQQPKVVDGYAVVEAVLDADATSDAATLTVRRLRATVHTVQGADAMVGGYTAITIDTRETAQRDNKVIIPAVLVVVLLVLMLLLRSLVAPLMLIATVVLSFAATLGVSALVFEQVFGFPGSDPALPLFAFVFLVALGIDYNIFLMTRVREESVRRGTPRGTIVGLRVTGGVITSAGVVLAATFAALGVIPMLFLAQIAFIVAFGVLLDTLVVRSLLVPALTVDMGRDVWWPSALSHRRG